MKHHQRDIWVVIVLLLITASRLIRLGGLAMNRDEIWSIWQTFGTPIQIVQWTPYDWPPGYYLILGAWRLAVGNYPLVLRIMSVLAFLIGAVFVLLIVRRWRGTWAGVLAMLAYAALGFSIQLSIEVRGYGLLMALYPLALWLTIRYFEHPLLWRGMLLGLALAAMFYISLTSIGAIIMLGLFSLLLYPRRMLNWWLPGGLALVLAVPEVLSKAQIVTSRVSATQTLVLPPLPDALVKLFSDFTGFTFVLWAVFLVVAGVLLFRLERRVGVALLIWTLVMPVILYVLNPVLGFFGARYSWWIMLGIALSIGWGVSYLPRGAILVCGLILVGMLYYPLPTGRYGVSCHRSVIILPGCGTICSGVMSFLTIVSSAAENRKNGITIHGPTFPTVFNSSIRRQGSAACGF